MSLDLATQRPRFVVEATWSDRPFDDLPEVRGLTTFSGRHPLLRSPRVTTCTKAGRKRVGDVEVEFSPAALHCYTVGKNTLEGPS